VSGPPPSSAEATAIIVLVLVSLILVRRIYLMIRGTVGNPARLFATAGLVVLLFAFTVGVGAAQSPLYFVGLDLGLLVLSSFLSTQYVLSHVRFERRPPSQALYYRLEPWIPLAYLLLFFARIGVSVAVLGPGVLEFAPVTGSLATGALVILQVVNALFAVSTGLLVGRSLGVYLAYRRQLDSTNPSKTRGPLAPLP
jgi:hypothetical protein